MVKINKREIDRFNEFVYKSFSDFVTEFEA